MKCIVLNSGLDKNGPLATYKTQHTNTPMNLGKWQCANGCWKQLQPSQNKISSSRTSKTTLKDAGVMVQIAVCVVQLAVVLAREHWLAAVALQSSFG